MDHKATTLALHLTFWAVLFATFQVFQILSSSSNLVFSNCVVVTLIYFGPVDFSLMCAQFIVMLFFDLGVMLVLAGTRQ